MATDSLDLEISNILNQVIAEAQVVQHFQYGHNLLQSAVQIDELFSMLDTMIKKVSSVINDVIPDINLAPYKDGFVDSTRANLCWIELTKDNYYGLILNTSIGVQYRTFTDDDIQNLLLNGQTASWYLVSKIQNLSYLISLDNDDKNKSLTIEYFKSLIMNIIERFFYEHEHSSIYHPAGSVTYDTLERVFSNFQIQNTNNISPAGDIESHAGQATWNQSLIKTNKHEICWQTAPDILLHRMDSTYAAKILSSKYLNERSDVAVFLKDTFDKMKNSNIEPNVYCFYSRADFAIPYVSLNYSIESQLRGYMEVEFESGEKQKIFPDTSPIVIDKGKNDITFITVVKISHDITKKIRDLVWQKGLEKYLPNMRIVCSLTGISKVFNERTE